MMFLKVKLIFLLIFCSVVSSTAQGPKQYKPSQTSAGYLLFAPLFSKTTYLINHKGQVAHTWTSRYNPAQSVYLLPDGTLLRTGNDSSRHFQGGGGVIELLDKNSTVKWQYQVSDSTMRQHHDVCPLPNGNILVLCWEKISKDSAIARGRKEENCPPYIWLEKIIEIQPKGKNQAVQVWQWRLWDHLVQDVDAQKKGFGKISETSGKLDINFLTSESADWTHFNSIDFDARSNQVLLSNRNLSEIYIIAHGTNTTSQNTNTIQQGDFLFRWGNPQTYGQGMPKDQQLFRQHHATWIKKGLKGEGQILLFNNGVQRGGGEEYSEVLSFSPHIGKAGEYLKLNGRYLPEKAEWVYQAKERSTFFSFNVSSAQRLPNANTLICEGAEGRFLEVTEAGETVWEYVNPYGIKLVPDRNEIQNQVFRCAWYSEKEAAIQHLRLKKLR